MGKNLLAAVVLLVSVGAATAAAQGWSVVTDGKFTHIYVYPDPATETWEQHLAGLPAALLPKDAKGNPDYARLTRASIDHFMDVLMTPASPSYFDWLYQYSGVRPPRFFGSGVASQRCVDAAMKDARSAGGVMQWDTIRSLSNCHNDGEDPSPQVALVFSPDIKIAKIAPFGTSGDMCATGGKTAWHAWGLSVPNFIALPTNAGCAKTFEDLTSHLTHEIVETLSDPGTVGEGGIWAADPNFESEVGDRCNDSSKDRTTLSGFTVTRYWSNSDNSCQPNVGPSPPATAGHDWLDASALPLVRFTGNLHDHAETVIAKDVGKKVLKLQLIISTGNDDLRGDGDNCDVTILLKDGRTIVLPNVNRNQAWNNWTIHPVDIPLPAGGLVGGDVAGIRLHTVSGGFDLTKSQDNWNLQRLQLRATVQTGLQQRLPDDGPEIYKAVVTVSVTIGRISDTAPIDPQYRDLVNDYAKVKVDGNYVVDPNGQPPRFSQTVRLIEGAAIQIELWRDVKWKFIRIGPDKNGKVFNQRVPDVRAGLLRTVKLSYDAVGHKFTGDIAGNAGAAVTLTSAGADAPGLSFSISDDQVKAGPRPPAGPIPVPRRPRP